MAFTLLAYVSQMETACLNALHSPVALKNALASQSPVGKVASLKRPCYMLHQVQGIYFCDRICAVSAGIFQGLARD